MLLARLRQHLDARGADGGMGLRSWAALPLGPGKGAGLGLVQLKRRRLFFFWSWWSPWSKKNKEKKEKRQAQRKTTAISEAQPETPTRLCLFFELVPFARFKAKTKGQPLVLTFRAPVPQEMNWRMRRQPNWVEFLLNQFQGAGQT